MPDFPRADSQRALTTQQPRALRNDADIQDRAGKMTKQTTAALDTAQQGMMQWQTHVDKVQQDTALYNYKIGMQKISNDAVLDTDITAEAKYQKQVQDLKKDVLKGVSSEYVKNNMAAELNYMQTVGAIGIQSEFRKKTVLHGQAVAQANLDLLAQSPGNEEAIKKATKDAIKTGYWDEPTAYAKEKKALTDMRQNSFIQDLNEDPAKAQQALLKNTYGFSVEELESAGKIYERDLKVIQNQNEKDFIQQKLDGTLKEDVIRDAIKKKKVDPQSGIAMIKDLNTVVQPQATQLDKVTAFNKLVAMRDSLKDKDPWFWTNSTFSERAKYRAEVFDAHRKGLISTDEMEKDFLSPEVSDKFMGDKVFQNAMKQVNSLSDQYQSREDKDIAKAMMSKDLTRKVMDGMRPDDALQVVSAERIQADFPDVKAEDLLYSAKKYGKPVWEIYKLARKK